MMHKKEEVVFGIGILRPFSLNVDVFVEEMKLKESEFCTHSW